MRLQGVSIVLSVDGEGVPSGTTLTFHADLENNTFRFSDSSQIQNHQVQSRLSILNAVMRFVGELEAEGRRKN